MQVSDTIVHQIKSASFADPRLSVDVHVAEIPALILAKGSKIGERLGEPRKGAVRDKDLGGSWPLPSVARQ